MKNGEWRMENVNLRHILRMRLGDGARGTGLGLEMGRVFAAGRAVVIDLTDIQPVFMDPVSADRLAAGQEVLDQRVPPEGLGLGNWFEKVGRDAVNAGHALQ